MHWRHVQGILMGQLLKHYHSLHEAYSHEGRFIAVVWPSLLIFEHQKDHEKPLIRVVVAIMKNFPFDIKNCDPSLARAQAEQAEQAKADARTRVIDATEEDDQDDMEVDDNADEEVEEVEPRINTSGTKASPQYILNSVLNKVLYVTPWWTLMVKQILPSLYRYLSQKTEDGVVLRTPVALAIVNLLLQLPESCLPVQLPQLLTKVVGPLKHRHVSIRDTTRQALTRVYDVGLACGSNQSHRLQPHLVLFISDLSSKSFELPSQRGEQP